MSPTRKSRVKALIKLRIFINICLEIMKNYEQLSSTISKFQAFFSKIRALFERFFAMFWALFFSLEKLLGVVWSYWVRVKVRVVNFLSRFFLFCQNVEHQYFFLDVKNNPANWQEYFFLDYSACQIFSLNLLVRENFLVLLDNFPNNTSLAFGDHSFSFRY